MLPHEVFGEAEKDSMRDDMKDCSLKILQVTLVDSYQPTENTIYSW